MVSNELTIGFGASAARLSRSTIRYDACMRPRPAHVLPQ
jgi:hypothetical protein